MKKILISLLFIGLNSTSTFAFVKSDSVIRPQLRSSAIVISALNAPTGYIKATYGQPLKRNRTVFGGIVPYNKIWRTGANEATEITFQNDVIFGGIDLKAGTYSLFTKPSDKNWKVILNSVLGQWGDTSYDSTKNVLEISVPVQKNNVLYEGFTISFQNESKAVNMNLMWDNVIVTTPILPKEAILNNTKKKKKKWF
jgi:hypothetical protein